MTRERLAENVSAFIAAIGEGATNGQVTAAIMGEVDKLIAAKLAENSAANLRTAPLGQVINALVALNRGQRPVDDLSEI